jgi:hypothetical protein
MQIAKPLAMVTGMVMLLLGCLFVGQGLNLIRWPADSFMIGVPQWSWNGMAMAMFGAALVWWARRK